MMSQLAQWWSITPSSEKLWLTIGFLAQMMFSMRFIVQWIASERARASIVPEVFWYFSLLGGMLLLCYAVYRLDPVFIIGQAAGILVYSRNIYFIHRKKSHVSHSSLSS
jgi:lipid-A-disaccharide synthase-like uncharacterized protein